MLATATMSLHTFCLDAFHSKGRLRPWKGFDLCIWKDGGSRLQGIPHSLRPRVWLAISGAARRRAEAADGYYTSMVVLGVGSSTYRDQIELVRQMEALFMQ